jgi:hypothetical protein
LDLLQVVALVGAIIYGAGKIVGSMTATTATLKSGLDQVSEDLEGLSRDVATLGQLANALQEAIGALSFRVGALEQAGVLAKKTSRPENRKKRPPKGETQRKR